MTHPASRAAGAPDRRRTRWAASRSAATVSFVAGSGRTDDAELAGPASRCSGHRAQGRETRGNRRSGVAAALALAVCWETPPPRPAASQTACQPPAVAGRRLLPGLLGPGDHFGSALAMGVLRNGDGVVAVGAYFSAMGGPDSGAVYLFTCPVGGVCSLVVPPLHGAPGDWFGFDVAIDGTQLLVGAPRAHDGSGAQTGAAYRFDLSNLPAGPVVMRGPLPLPRGHAGDEIGSAVALSGSDWAVGARSDGQAGVAAGSVYVCCRGPIQKLLPDAPAAGAEFGQSVSLDGGILAVGAPFAEPAGAAYVFTAGATSWQPTPRLTPPAAVPAGAAFGYAVALSGTRVVVGAPLDDDGGKGAGAGAAYLYQRAQGIWGPQPSAPRLDAGSEAGAGAQFGVAVAVDRAGQGEILAGARRANGDRGAAYRFGSDGSSLGIPLSSPLPQAGAEFGFEAAIFGGTLVVGAFLQDGGAGAAFVFTPVTPFQRVIVTLAAEKIAFPESPGMVMVPVIVATSDGQPTTAPVTVQVDAVAGIAVTGSHFQLLTHHAAITIPTCQPPGAATMVKIAFVPDPPCMVDETFTVELRDPVGAVLGTPRTENVVLHDDLPPIADLQVTAIAPIAPSAVVAGDPIVYGWQVQNLGRCPAQQVLLSEPLPAGLDLIGESSSCLAASGVLSCRLGTLAPLAAAQVHTRYQVPCNRPAGSIMALATVTSDTADPNPANDSAKVTTAVTVVADYSIVKTCPAAELAGEQASYTLEVHNLGPSCPQAAVLDPLPTHLLSSRWCCGTACSPTQTGDVAAQITLSAGASEVCSVAGVIDPGFSGPLFNTATVALSAGSDPVSGNNASRCTTTVVPGREIPTLAPIALIALALLLAALAYAKLRGMG